MFSVSGCIRNGFCVLAQVWIRLCVFWLSQIRKHKIAFALPKFSLRSLLLHMTVFANASRAALWALWTLQENYLHWRGKNVQNRLFQCQWGYKPSQHDPEDPQREGTTGAFSNIYTDGSSHIGQVAIKKKKKRGREVAINQHRERALEGPFLDCCTLQTFPRLMQKAWFIFIDYWSKTKLPEINITSMAVVLFTIHVLFANVCQGAWIWRSQMHS